MLPRLLVIVFAHPALGLLLWGWIVSSVSPFLVLRLYVVSPDSVGSTVSASDMRNSLAQLGLLAGLWFLLMSVGVACHSLTVLPPYYLCLPTDAP